MLEGAPELRDQVFPKLLDDVYTTGVAFEGFESKAVLVRNEIPVDTYFNFVYQPYRDVDNSISGVTVLASEVTEQVLAKKQIEISEKRFSNLILQAPVSIMTYRGPSFVIETANQLAIESLGKPYEDIINKPLFEISPELADGLKDILQSIYISGETYINTELKIEIVRPGKPNQAYFNTVYQPLRDLDNNIYGIMFISTEITEAVNARKRIEANRLIIENIYMNAPAVICTFKGPKHIYDLVNPSYQNLFDKRDLIGKPLIEALPELIGQGIDKILDNVYITGEIFTNTEIPVFVAKSDQSEPQQRYYNMTMQPIYDEDNKIIGVINFGYDVTEQLTARKLIEESAALAEDARQVADRAKTKAEAATKIAEDAVMSKQQFLSNMSHEIRTPMNAIIGFTKVLMKTDLSEKQKEYVQAVKSSGDTLIVLINDILDLAKVDAGKMIFLNAPFKIAHSITTILHLFEPKIQENNLELIKQYDSRIPEIVLGDSVRLHQILINLLTNAIKFTAKGKITLSVNLLKEDEEKVTLEIKVADTGIGIPQNKMAAIFENFEQAHNINSNLYGGTGLGLAIVKQLVEKQGGTISVKSKMDEGSTFSFTLAFEKTNVELAFENDEREYEAEIKPIKVLVVEDVKLNQLLIKTILDDFKFECDIADNGKIAIEKLETNYYDIILMDLQMPVINGFQATEHIRTKMNLQTPIIALTADVTTVDMEKCKSIGMNDYISKPLDEKLLHSKILDVIKTK